MAPCQKKGAPLAPCKKKGGAVGVMPPNTISQNQGGGGLRGGGCIQGPGSAAPLGPLTPLFMEYQTFFRVTVVWGLGGRWCSCDTWPTVGGTM